MPAIINPNAIICACVKPAKTTGFLRMNSTKNRGNPFKIRYMKKSVPFGNSFFLSCNKSIATINEKNDSKRGVGYTA